MDSLAYVRENFHKSGPELARELGKSERHIRRLRQKVKAQLTDSGSLSIQGGKDEISFSGLEAANPLSPGDAGAFAKIFELAGADPEHYELVEDTFKFTTWQQSKASESGERDLVQLYSYRGTFRAKNPAILTIEDVLPYLECNSSCYNPSGGEARGTFVIALSDLQLGKTDERGGTPDTLARVATIFDGIERELESSPTFAEIVLYDVGDIVEGFTNTTQQQQTNDLSLTDQLRAAQAVILNAFERFAHLAPVFTYVSVPSNHCQVRSSAGNKNRSNSPDDDYGVMLLDNIQQAVELTGAYPNARFIRPERWEEAVAVTVADGTVLGCVHGHQFGAPARSGAWLAESALSGRAGMDTVDTLVFGHHHNFFMGVAGHGQQLIGCPTLDNGSAWFSNNRGASTPPAMLTFVLDNKRSKGWKIWEA